MTFHHPTRWLPIAAVPLCVGAALWWLLLIFAGDRTGVVPLQSVDGVGLSYYIDPGGRLTQPEIANLSSDRWQDWPREGYISGQWGETYWVRASLTNPTDAPVNGVLESGDFFTDRVDAWISGETGGEPMRMLSGEAVEAGKKAISGRDVAFAVSIPARSERFILLRMDDACGAFVTWSWWWEATMFHRSKTREGQAEGIYFGGMLALLGYNILLWLRLRQADIGFYVLYLAMAAGFMFLARAQFPAMGVALGSPWLQKLLSVVMVLSGSFLTWFALAFLQVGSVFTKIDRGLRRWAWLLLAVAAVIALIPEGFPGAWMRCAALVTALTHVGLLVLVVVAWRAGVWQARFFALSFGCLFAGSLPAVGVWFFETTYRDAAMRGLMIGSALEMLLLSLAVADRFARAQRLLMEETEQRRMIQAAYSDELEEEVRERTRELRESNIEKDRMLAVIGHDLRGPLTGLMRSADDVAGEFSKDVARTGRALLLMIEDLVLWTRLRVGRKTTAVHRAMSVVMPAVALHRTLAEHDGVELVLDVPEELRVETDLVLAQTLVRNLLANALKFARSKVVIRVSAEADGVRFMIGNDGPTLSPAVMARLAAGEDEPMTATGGMGLKLCREICAALRIRLEASSPVRGGAEFGFKLNQTDDEEANHE